MRRWAFFFKYKGDETSSNRKIEHKDDRTLRPAFANPYLKCSFILSAFDHGFHFP